MSLRLFNDRLILVEQRVFFASVALHSSFFPAFKKIKFLLLRYKLFGPLSLPAHFSIVIQRFRFYAFSNINYVIASILSYFIIP